MTEDDPVSYQWFGATNFTLSNFMNHDLVWVMYAGICVAGISYNIAMLWFHDLTTDEVMIILWLFDRCYLVVYSWDC